MDLKNAKRIVVKVGTSTLTYDSGNVNYKRFEDLARVLSDIMNQGKEVILVSSGAISVGTDKMHLNKRPELIGDKQAAAAVGQCELMNIYSRSFSNYNHLVGQILLSSNILRNSEGKFNVINTFKSLLKNGRIPIVNENDSVSIEELTFGDNDALSSIVAIITEADLVIIMSDVDGLYNADPRTNTKAELIETVYEVTEELERISGGSGSNRGTGGMQTKIHAAENAMKNSINLVVANGERPENIYDILDGKSVGTLFVKSERTKENE